MMTLRGSMSSALAVTRQAQAADEQFLFEERAAIIEYDGNETRAYAENLARRQVEDIKEREGYAPLLAIGSVFGD